MGCVPSSQAEKEGMQAKEERMRSPIRTIVVLVMENRSFDHMLGWQKKLHPEIDGVTGKEYNTITTSNNANAEPIYYSDDARYVVGDPGHSYQAVREQLYGSDTANHPIKPLMSGFAKQAETVSQGLSKSVMSGFKPEALPIYTSLVKEFAVFDKWFASVPASTQPNRLYVHSATSHGLMSNVRSELLKGLPQRTIFDNLYDENLTFGIYFQSLPSTFIYRRLRQLKYINHFHPYHLSFKHHASEGKLPNYVVIEPRFFNHENPPANDDHPPHDVSLGQALVKEVYETLRASPQWEETLLIITYDEHGGFYDHVSTPVTNVPNPDDINGPSPYYFKFDRLGVRVPTIMISPWIEKRTIIHTPSGPTPFSQFEHSSIAATVKKLFNLSSTFLTKRDAWAGTFESIVLSRSTPRTDCPKTLPSVTKDANASKAMFVEGDKDILSEFQEDIVHLATHLNGEKDKAEELIKMGVKEAAKYVEKALTMFLSICEEARQAGADTSSIVCLKPSTTHDGKPTYYLEPCE